MKKIYLSIFALVTACIIFGTNVYAAVEIPDYSVDVTYQLDFFNQKSIRDAEYTITDSGRFKNQYDVVDFGILYDGVYNLEDLKNDDYKTMVIELNCKVAEINDGYQYIYFYDDTTSNTFLNGARFEHGPGKKKTTEEEYTFYCEIPLSNVLDNDFVIRYDASGKNDDDWLISNVYVQIGFSKEAIKTSYIWNLQWDNEEHSSYTCTRLVKAQ